ncbi:MAG: thiamine pyrophosphate-binding protein, partial [Actinomycetes bacterium]
MTSGPSVTVSDLILQTLSNAGVSMAFGLPGVHNLAFWRSLDVRDTHASGVRVITVRHEQTAAY